MIAKHFTRRWQRARLIDGALAERIVGWEAAYLHPLPSAPAAKTVGHAGLNASANVRTASSASARSGRSLLSP